MRSWPGVGRPAPGADRAGLVRYLCAATLARSADGGAAVGLLLWHRPVGGGRHAGQVAAPGAPEPAQRRAQGWDAVSYGVGSTVGPAIVAALTVGAALRFMAASGPLRRVTAATALTALSTGGLPIIAIALGLELTSRPGNGAVLVTAYGLGTLTGSLIVTAFPLRGEPEALVVRHTAIMALSLGLCAVAPTYLLAVAAFAVAGANSAAMFTATLAARSRYSAPSARAQVFVTMAGLKVAMASAGVVAAGATIGIGSRPLLGISAGVVLFAATGIMLDRHRSACGADGFGSGLDELGHLVGVRNHRHMARRE
jgi:hypothetical protein